MVADGSNQIPLTENGDSDFLPAWSPDGTKIAFSKDVTADGIPNAEIYVMNPNGTSPQNVTMSTADDSDPDWQPAG